MKKIISAEVANCQSAKVKMRNIRGYFLVVFTILIAIKANPVNENNNKKPAAQVGMDLLMADMDMKEDRNRDEEINDLNMDAESGTTRIEERLKIMLGIKGLTLKPTKPTKTTSKIISTVTSTTPPASASTISQTFPISEPSTTSTLPVCRFPDDSNESSETGSSSESKSEEITSPGALCRKQGMENCFNIFKNVESSEKYSRFSKYLEKCISLAIKKCKCFILNVLQRS